MTSHPRSRSLIRRSAPPSPIREKGRALWFRLLFLKEHCPNSDAQSLADCGNDRVAIPIASAFVKRMTLKPCRSISSVRALS